MNVNIFMKQFKMPNAEVVKKLREGDAETLGQEKLMGLLKVLPESDEVKKLLISFRAEESVIINF